MKSTFEIMSSKIGNWLLLGNTGLSSEFMAATALGADAVKNPKYPCDGGDFGRCLELVNGVPEIKDYFGRIANSSKEWRLIIDSWDEIVKAQENNDSVYEFIFKLTRPTEFKENQNKTEKRDAEIADKQERDRLAVESPERNHNGVVIFPKLNNPIVNEWCRNKAAKAAVSNLAEYGFVTKHEQGSTIEELSDELKYRSSGYSIYKSMGFANENTASEIIEILDSISVSHEYNDYLSQWAKKQNFNIKPAFKIGDAVVFKRNMEELVGTIEKIANHRPFSYEINIGNPKLFPVLYWDDETLSKLEG